MFSKEFAGKNEFFSYSTEKTPEGYNVEMCDLDRKSHFICFTFSKNVADHLVKYFDNLAIAEERELFEELIK